VNESMKAIRSLIRARFPIIWIRSVEEMRVQSFFQEMAPEFAASKKTLWGWTFTNGVQNLTDPKERPNGDLSDPAAIVPHICTEAQASKKRGHIWLLKDFHDFLDSPLVRRQLRDAYQVLQESFSTIILLSPLVNIPIELEGEVAVVDFELPNLEEIERIANARIVSVKNILEEPVPDAARLRKISEACLGMTAAQVEGVLSRSIVDFKKIKLSFILTEKEEVIKKSGLMEFFPPTLNMDDVGGLDQLKTYTEQRKGAFTEKAKEYGLPNPNGVLLLGVQGCGKSLTAKAFGGELELPVLRLDAGRLFGGIIGQSEENVRTAIKLAETVSPCILWVDEIEKGLSGSKSSNFTDGGTSARVFGTFITWLQEKEKPVFVVATANDVSQMPPELIRKGRFDEIKEGLQAA